MNYKKLLILSIAIPTLFLGCAAIEEKYPEMAGKYKQISGAFIGAAAGGLLGYKTGKGNRTLAALLGMASGAWIGSKIGAHLDEVDRRALEAESARALSKAKDGEAVKWSSDESGASATLTPQNTRIEQREITVLRDKRVAPVPELELIGEQYEAINVANVRSAPTKDAERVGSLRPGETFTAVGKVMDGNWILVAKNKISVGYVYAPLVRSCASETQPELRQAINLDDVEAVEDTKISGIDLDGVEMNVEAVAESVPVETKCRTMDYEVTNKDGKTEQNKFDACRGADGAWELG